MKLTGAQIIMEVLIEQGVDTVFGYPGGSVLALYDALYSYSDKIRHVLTSHEQGAAHAADGYARATGKVGVCMATSGPGATNLVTGIAAAFMDSVPVVAITGNVASSLLGRDSFQEVDITGITMPITKHSFIVNDVHKLAHTLREAFRIASSGRKGPVLVDIPKNITLALADYEPHEKVLPSPARPPKEKCVERAVEVIKNAKKPLFYVGGGLVSSGASEEFIKLAEKLDIPVASSMMGLGGFPSSHPLYLGLIGMHGKFEANKAARECDVLIAAGARFSDRVASNRAEFSPRSKIIHMDIDPAEMDKNLLSEYHLRGDLKELCPLLYELLPSQEHKEWRETIKSWGRDYPIPERDGFANPQKILETLRKMTNDDDIIVTDVGQHQMWTAQHYKFEKPRTFITSGGLGAMGFGLGAAIGASLGKPDKRVILISGDGSFHMNLNELATLASFNIPVIDIVMNNSVLGMVRQWQNVFYSGRHSQVEPNRKTDLVRLAEAFGIEGMTIHDNSDIQSVLEKAFSLNAPVLIDCKISPDDAVLPMIPPGGAVYDTMDGIKGGSR